jgi:hypothetical protein
MDDVNFLDLFLFSRDKIRNLSPSAMKDTLMEILNLPPEALLEDVVNYWCFKNYRFIIYNKMNYRNYGKILKAITPKTKDFDEFHQIISTYLKRLI